MPGYQKGLKLAVFFFSRFPLAIANKTQNKLSSEHHENSNNYKALFLLVHLLYTHLVGVSELGPLPEIILAQIYRPPSILNPGTV
jgi:hypothetical protein